MQLILNLFCLFCHHQVVIEMEQVTLICAIVVCLPGQAPDTVKVPTQQTKSQFTTPWAYSSQAWVVRRRLKDFHTLLTRLKEVCYSTNLPLQRRNEIGLKVKLYATKIITV